MLEYGSLTIRKGLEISFKLRILIHPWKLLWSFWTPTKTHPTWSPRTHHGVWGRRLDDSTLRSLQWVGARPGRNIGKVHWCRVVVARHWWTRPTQGAEVVGPPSLGWTVDLGIRLIWAMFSWGSLNSRCYSDASTVACAKSPLLMTTPIHSIPVFPTLNSPSACLAIRSTILIATWCYQRAPQKPWSRTLHLSWTKVCPSWW